VLWRSTYYLLTLFCVMVVLSLYLPSHPQSNMTLGGEGSRAATGGGAAMALKRDRSFAGLRRRRRVPRAARHGTWQRGRAAGEKNNRQEDDARRGCQRGRKTPPFALRFCLPALPGRTARLRTAPPRAAARTEGLHLGAGVYHSEEALALLLLPGCGGTSSSTLMPPLTRQREDGCLKLAYALRRSHPFVRTSGLAL